MELDDLIYRRKRATKYFQKKKSNREVMRLNGFSSGAVFRIRKKIKSDKTDMSVNAFASQVRPGGVSTLLGEEKEKLISNGLFRCAARGFAPDTKDLKRSTAAVARQIGTQFK